MDFQQVGRIHKIGQSVKVTQHFQSRHLVLDCSVSNPHTGRTFPNFPVFEAVQAKGDLLDDFEPGEQVIVTFEIRGREAKNGGFYNTLRLREIARYPFGGAKTDNTNSASDGGQSLE